MSSKIFGQGHSDSVVVARGLRSTRASGIAVLGLCCSGACGIFVPHQGSNSSPLYCKADSLPLGYQGSPAEIILNGLATVGSVLETQEGRAGVHLGFLLGGIS